MDRLRLMALDEADLAVISACLQDAVFKIGDTAWQKTPSGAGTFTLEANRFVWEGSARRKDNERRRALLAIKDVRAVRSRGIDRDKKDEVLSLLAVRFAPSGDEPAGTLELVLSGGGSIALEVECIEVELADVSGSWGTGFRPRHPLD